ncbi:MAG: hypothetical protein GC159_16150 [Phycisphaera sp.]|nr:hypothetical protein [Phycisphaera sp.]
MRRMTNGTTTACLMAGAMLTLAMAAAPASAQLTLTKKQTFTGHGEGVLSVAFSQDGKSVAAGTGALGETARDGSIRVWSLAEKKTTALFPAPGPVRDVTFTNNSKFVTCAAHANVRTVNLEDHELYRVLDRDATDFFRVAVTPDEKHVIAVGTESVRYYAFVWDFTTFEVVAKIEGQFSVVEVSPDGKTLVLGGHDNRVHLFDTTTWKPVRSIGEERSRRVVEAIAISPDSKRVMTWAKRSGAVVWDMASGESVVTLAPMPRQVNAAKFSPDGSHILLGSDKLLIYNASSGKKVGEVDAHGGDVTDLDFSPDGSMLVTSGLLDEAVTVWSVD